MSLQESGEMYLETIYLLSKDISPLRSIDICERMGYSKPSVSRAISILKKEGYITTNKHNHIFLTDEGLTVANKIYERHTILKDFFIKLGVDPQTASEDACKIEHVISDISFEKIKLCITSTSIDKTL